MANNETKIIITAQDQTKAAFDSAKANLGNLQAVAGQLKGALATLGVGVSAASFVSFVKGTIDAADHINDLSQSLGISVRELAKYQLAAAQSGTSMEAIGKGIKGLATNLAEHGNALREAGITAKTADGALRQVADIFEQMPDGLEKTTLAVKLFGKSGMELIPMLNQGSAGLAQAAEKSAKYAAVMATLAPQADKFNDTLAELGMSSKVAGLSMINDMLPGMTSIAAAMAQAALEAGTLKAAWVGLGGLGWEAVFKPATVVIKGITNDLDEMILRMQKFLGAPQKLIDERAGAIAGRWRDISDLTTSSAAVAQESPKQFDEAAWIAKYKKMLASLGGAGNGHANKPKADPELWKKLQEGDEAWQKEFTDAWAAYAKTVNETFFEVDRAAERSIKGWVEYAEALTKQGDEEAKQLAELQIANLQATDEITEFWKQAAHSMQESMSEFFFDVMQGNLSDLSGSFKASIDRMVADVLAAKAATALFGSDFGKGGEISGLVGKGLGWLTGLGGGGSGAGAWTSGADLPLGSYATGTDYVPKTGLYRLHQGEQVVPAADNRRNVAVVNNFTISGDASRASQAQIAAAAGLGVQRALARNG